jgi:hypothetical protein
MVGGGNSLRDVGIQCILTSVNGQQDFVVFSRSEKLQYNYLVIAILILARVAVGKKLRPF